MTMAGPSASHDAATSVAQHTVSVAQAAVGRVPLTLQRAITLAATIEQASTVAEASSTASLGRSALSALDSLIGAVDAQVGATNVSRTTPQQLVSYV
jgi:hypothetical protein